MKLSKAKLISAIAILTMTATNALASSVHFKPRSPRFTDNGLTLTASGALAGLGNGDVVIFLTATGTPTAFCRNPSGHLVPGQNPAEVTLSGVQAIPESKIKNGSVNFSVTTTAPAQPTPAEAGCPNGNWTASIADVHFTSATIQVYQAGVLVLSQTVGLSTISEMEGVLEAFES